MSSRFVSAGTDQTSISKKDDWEQARQEVENRRAPKPVQSGKQDDGRSLYEVLQANKAAKQEAFEEATKIRNQFRPLDDSEIEFLDSVRQSERAKEDILKRETAEQLDAFRKNKVEAEQAAAGLKHENSITEQISNDDLWVTSKKRRREQGEEARPLAKLTKSLKVKEEENTAVGAKTDRNEKSTLTENSDTRSPSESKPLDEDAKKPKVSTGLGLVAYSSDDDDDD